MASISQQQAHTAMLGYPIDSEVQVATSTSRLRDGTGASLGPYQVQIVGIRIPDAEGEQLARASHRDRSVFAVPHADGTHWYRVFLTRIRREGATLYYERSVFADGSMHESIHGTEALRTRVALKNAVDELWEGLRILRSQGAKPGAPRGSGGYFRDVQHFHEVVDPIVRRIWENTGRQPSQSAVRVHVQDAMGGMTCTDRTFHNWVTKTQYGSWPVYVKAMTQQ